MKNVRLLMLLALSLLIPSVVHAESSTNVSISNNGEGAHANVSVSNNTGTNVVQSSSTTSRTDIRIENNGKVKEYHSDKPGSVTIQSDDGNSKVEINNSGNTQQTMLSPEEQQAKEEKIKQEVKAEQDKVKKQLAEQKKKAEAAIQQAQSQSFDLRTFFMEQWKKVRSLFTLKFFFN